MEQAPPIARGFTAEIYAWQDGYILKLFNAGISRKTVEYEANITRAVHGSGLPVPMVGEVVEVDGRYGLELERLDGISMLEALTSMPWRMVTYARQLAELQAKMHTIRATELPSLSERLARKIHTAEILPELTRQAALKALAGLPQDDKLCHGDFHPGNIQLTSRGAVIIDWIDATHGSPLLDLARSSLLFGDVHLPPEFPKARLLNLIQKWFYNTYHNRYLQLNPIDENQLKRWIPVVAAARLDENIRFDEMRLLSIANRLLEEGDE